MHEVDPKNLIVGFDVGSTTVKSVVVDATTPSSRKSAWNS